MSRTSTARVIAATRNPTESVKVARLAEPDRGVERLECVLSPGDGVVVEQSREDPLRAVEVGHGQGGSRYGKNVRSTDRRGGYSMDSV